MYVHVNVYMWVCLGVYLLYTELFVYKLRVSNNKHTYYWAITLFFIIYLIQRWQIKMTPQYHPRDLNSKWIMICIKDKGIGRPIFVSDKK